MLRKLSVFFACFAYTSLLLGADAPIPEDRRPKIDIRAISIKGVWSPGSRAYFGYPGNIKVNEEKIEIGNCKNITYMVISDQSKEDSLWNGTDKDREVRAYRDITIRVLPSRGCKVVQEPIFRFLMPTHIPCYASLMLYSSEKDIETERYAAWGGYHNETCTKEYYPPRP